MANGRGSTVNTAAPLRSFLRQANRPNRSLTVTDYSATEYCPTCRADSGSRRVLAQDREQDRDGGGSVSTVTVGRGSGTQEVVPLQTLAPEFRGALVVCPGGGDARVRLMLTQAVSALTGLGTDRISICEGNP